MNHYESAVGFENKGHELRKDIKAVALKVKKYAALAKVIHIPEGAERGEMIANATLTYRHLEDAAMRIGKALQAHQGGVSILDKIQAENKDAVTSVQQGAI